MPPLGCCICKRNQQLKNLKVEYDGPLFSTSVNISSRKCCMSYQRFSISWIKVTISPLWMSKKKKKKKIGQKKGLSPPRQPNLCELLLFWIVWPNKETQGWKKADNGREEEINKDLKQNLCQFISKLARNSPIRRDLVIWWSNSHLAWYERSHWGI